MTRCYQKIYIVTYKHNMTRFMYTMYAFFQKNSNKTTTMLGRWNVKTNKKHEDTITFWANSDHCGDVICGNPIENKKILDNN